MLFFSCTTGSDPDDPKTRHCYVLKSENKHTDISLYECVFENCNSKILMRDGIKRYFNASSARSIEDYQNNFVMIDIETKLQERATDSRYDDDSPFKLYSDVMNTFRGSNVTLPVDHKDKLVQLIKYYRLKRKRENTAPILPIAGVVTSAPKDTSESTKNDDPGTSLASPRATPDASKSSPATAVVSQRSNEPITRLRDIESKIEGI